MKSPTKRLFYHFSVYALYLAPFWLHFGIVGTVGGIILLLKRHLKRLSGNKFQEISQ